MVKCKILVDTTVYYAEYLTPDDQPRVVGNGFIFIEEGTGDRYIIPLSACHRIVVRKEAE